MKINPNYKRGQTVYVTDASRAVGVASALMSHVEPREVCRRRAANTRIADRPARAQDEKQRLPLKDARANALQARLGERYAPPEPAFLGNRVIDDFLDR